MDVDFAIIILHKDDLYDAFYCIQNDELDGLPREEVVALEFVLGYSCFTVARQMEAVLQEKLHKPTEELRNEVAMAPLDTFAKNLNLEMTHKSARSVIKDYFKHQKDIDERIRQNQSLKQQKHSVHPLPFLQVGRRRGGLSLLSNFQNGGLDSFQRELLGKR